MSHALTDSFRQTCLSPSNAHDVGRNGRKVATGGEGSQGHALRVERLMPRLTESIADIKWRPQKVTTKASPPR
jgi:hypothetical protein